MATTWLVRNATATGAIGHSFNSSGGTDTYGNSRFFTSFDLTAYSDADVVIYGPTADGTLIRTETVPSGDPPTPVG